MLIDEEVLETVDIEIYLNECNTRKAYCDERSIDEVS